MKAMDDSMLRIQEGTEIANNTMIVFNEIIDAINTTSKVTEEINEAIAKQTASLESVIDCTVDMTDTSKRVTSLVDIASLNTQYTKTSLKILAEVSKDLHSISNKLLEEIDTDVLAENVLNISINSKPIEFDPQLAHDQESAQVLFNIMVHFYILVQQEKSLQEWLSLGMWKMMELLGHSRLRKGAKFHNGREITANDVKYSYERMLKSKGLILLILGF